MVEAIGPVLKNMEKVNKMSRTSLKRYDPFPYYFADRDRKIGDFTFSVYDEANTLGPDRTMKIHLFDEISKRFFESNLSYFFACNGEIDKEIEFAKKRSRLTIKNITNFVHFALMRRHTNIAYFPLTKWSVNELKLARLDPLSQNLLMRLTNELKKDKNEWSNIKKKNRAAGIIEEDINLEIMKTKELQVLTPKVTKLYESLGELINADESYKKSTIKEIRKAFSSIQRHSKFWDTIEKYGKQG